jgi:uncharacterized protein
MTGMAEIISLYRYPVKGLSPEPLESAALKADSHFPGDRMFAVENGPSGFDPRAAEQMPKIKFLMLMRNERLARLKTRYDDGSGVLSISQAEELRGVPRLLTAPPGFRFMDSRNGFLSIIDLASIAAIAKAAGRKAIDPLRFRANIYVAGLGAWSEFDLVGKQVKLGGATLEIIKPIDRCAATDVDPSTGIRDLRMVELLEQKFGHNDCGVYARIVSGGDIKKGDLLTAL